MSTEGIKAIECLTHELLLSYVLKDVSFSTVGGRHKELFAFVQKDEALDIINCHVFLCVCAVCTCVYSACFMCSPCSLSPCLSVLSLLASMLNGMEMSNQTTR